MHKIFGKRTVLDNEQHPAYAKLSWGIDAGKDQVVVMHALVSSPRYQGKGIGKRLIKYSFDYARKRNALAIRLDTHHINTPARSLYVKCGFREIGQLEGSASGVRQTFIVYEYVL